MSYRIWQKKNFKTRLISFKYRFNGEKHTNLHCSLKNGWENEKGIVIASAETKLELLCEECNLIYLKMDDFDRLSLPDCTFSHIYDEYYPSSKFYDNQFFVTANKICALK